MVSAATILAAALAATLGLLPAARWERYTPWHGVAAAFVLFPVLDDLVGFVQVAPLVTQPTTLQPYSLEQLARLPWRIARNTLGAPVVGLALVAALGGAAVAREHLDRLPTSWPAWRSQLALGWTTVPIVVGAEAVAIALLQGPASFLATGDESALFANAGLEHVLLLSIVPALVEEIYYRGLLQGLLEEVGPTRGRVWLAIGVQGVLFGVAHGGYANLAHILGPLAFGLGMGYLRSTVGIGACVVAHAGVNLFYFSVDPGAGSTGLQVAVVLASLAGLVGLWLARRTLWARVRAGPRPARSPAPTRSR